jgi:hypothetical protein
MSVADLQKLKFWKSSCQSVKLKCFQGYFVSLFNRFDFFVVLSSLLELILTNQNVMPPLGKIDSRFPLVERSLRYDILGSYWPICFNQPECDATIR